MCQWSGWRSTAKDWLHTGKDILDMTTNHWELHKGRNMICGEDTFSIKPVSQVGELLHVALCQKDVCMCKIRWWLTENVYAALRVLLKLWQYSVGQKEHTSCWEQLHITNEHGWCHLKTLLLLFLIQKWIYFHFFPFLNPHRHRKMG